MNSMKSQRYSFRIHIHAPPLSLSFSRRCSTLAKWIYPFFLGISLSNSIANLRRNDSLKRTPESKLPPRESSCIPFACSAEESSCRSRNESFSSCSTASSSFSSSSSSSCSSPGKFILENFEVSRVRRLADAIEKPADGSIPFHLGQGSEAQTTYARTHARTLD